MQTRLFPLFLYAFLLVGASASAQESADVAKRAADISKESQSCVDCHRSGAAPLALQQWERRRHAQAGIGCYECHQADKERLDGFEHFGQRISVMVTPKSCGTCHAQEAQEFQASHHAQAGQILGSLDCRCQPL
jgi:hydroxylamine dehydrogenase